MTMEFRPDPKPDPRQKKKPVAIRKSNPTGELQLFQEILVDRSSASQVSHKPIYTPSPSNFAHILNKKKYPHFLLYEQNIVLMTVTEHNQYDNKPWEIDWSTPGWNAIKRLKEVLLELYHEKYGIVK